MLKYRYIGALTSKPFAFTFRSWETTARKFVDFLDILALDILIENRQHKIIRVLPLIAYQTPRNIWLSDRIRYLLPVLDKNRLTSINFLFKVTDPLERLIFNINNAFEYTPYDENDERFWYITRGISFLLPWLCTWLADDIVTRVDIVSNSTTMQSALRYRNLSYTYPQTHIYHLAKDKTINLETSFMRSHYLLKSVSPQLLQMADIFCIGIDLRKVSPSLFIYIQNSYRATTRFLLTLLLKVPHIYFFNYFQTAFGGSHFQYLTKFIKGRHLTLNYTYVTSLFFQVYYGYEFFSIYQLHHHLQAKYRTNFDIVNFVPYNLGTITALELGSAINNPLIDTQYNDDIIEEKLNITTIKCFLNEYQEVSNLPWPACDWEEEISILYMQDPENINFDGLFYDLVIYSGSQRKSINV